MLRIRSGTVIALAASVLALPAIAADATPRGAQPAQRTGTGDEYVVVDDAAAAERRGSDRRRRGHRRRRNGRGRTSRSSSAGDDAFAAEVRGRRGVTGSPEPASASPGRTCRTASSRSVQHAERTRPAPPAGRGDRPGGVTSDEPLAELQWDMAMIGATPTGAHRRATGRGVDVGIIDTGIDGSHPDIAPNFEPRRSATSPGHPDHRRPCEVAPASTRPNVDEGGHGTHVAGTVAAARNGFGIAGVAPDATLVNLRAGQDSGYFFMYETVAALV